MLLAYLRGLLQPAYDQGQRSVLRENMVLAAISTELDAATVGGKVALDAAYSEGISPRARVEYYGRQLDLLGKQRSLAELDDTFEPPAAGDLQVQEDLFELYKALEKAGLVGVGVADIADDKTDE